MGSQVWKILLDQKGGTEDVSKPIMSKKDIVKNSAPQNNTFPREQRVRERKIWVKQLKLKKYQQE